MRASLLTEFLIEELKFLYTTILLGNDTEFTQADSLHDATGAPHQERLTWNKEHEAVHGGELFERKERMRKSWVMLQRKTIHSAAENMLIITGIHEEQYALVTPKFLHDVQSLLLIRNNGE